MLFKRLTLLWSVLRGDARTLWFALRHPGAPGWLKLGTALIVLYVISPIDLIPDFIPVLGYVDDALLLPALIWLAVRLLPAHVVDECRLQAQAWMEREKSRPASYAGAAAIVAIWIGVLYWLAHRYLN